MFFGDCRGRPPRPAGVSGFGYDPVFIPDATGVDRTMAELTDAEKDAISHRGHAVRALTRWFRGLSAGGADAAREGLGARPGRRPAPARAPPPPPP